ncbi:MAG: phytanoyl-CoA dioxygenase family protein [Candidatus Rhabdochlamydia sp.]
MQTLNESKVTDSITNLQAAFYKNGYLFIRSFFPTNLIITIRECIIDVLESEGWGEWKDDAFIAIEPVNRINSPSFYHGISTLMQQEILHEIAHHPYLNSFLSSLLDEPIFSHPRKMVRITYPYSMNSKDRVPPHQDLVYVKGERDTFTTWIPLGDYPPEQGGLEVSPQSHRSGLYAMQANSEGRFGCTAIEEHLTNFSWCKAHYHPGDLLVMHSLTLHRSGINESKQFRLSLDCRFSSALKTLNEDQLLPPYYPYVPSWEVLSKKWKNPKRFELPSTMKVHQKDKELSKVLMTSSRFAE